MRVCPKCGYVEQEYWRQNRWRSNVEWTKPPEFEYNYPDLAKQLKKGIILTDEFYAYKLGGKSLPVVQRVLLSEYKAFGEKAFSMPAEHIEHDYGRKVTPKLETFREALV